MRMPNAQLKSSGCDQHSSRHYPQASVASGLAAYCGGAADILTAETLKH